MIGPILIGVSGFALSLYGFSWGELSQFFSEEHLIQLLKEYGYIILFVWSFFEGETGLIMAGILSYTGDMNLYLSIVVAALGGFLGDQFYFYLGRFNKKWVLEEFRKHRRKVAQARLLLNRYGGWVIFIQRFLYGLRTILPITIGVTGYDPKKFAIINLISAFIWASLSIVLAYIFGEQLLNLLKWVKEHWYIAVPIGVGMVGGVLYLSYRDEINRARKKGGDR